MTHHHHARLRIHRLFRATRELRYLSGVRVEDDPVQLVHPLLQGGANRKSLAESQIAILKTIPVAVREQGGSDVMIVGGRERGRIESAI